MKRTFGIAVLAVTLLLTFPALWLFPRRTAARTEYQGKSVQRWFEEAVKSEGTGDYQISGPFRAFEEMEGDAVSFLTRRVTERPSVFQRAYAKAIACLPAQIVRKLPRSLIPLTRSDYINRRDCALELLAAIGRGQRFKAAEGEPSPKPSIALAVPAIQTALRDTNGYDPVFAAQAAASIGPPAASTIPDLMYIVQMRNGSRAVPGAIQAFGIMGPLASNAVPLLITIAASPRREERLLAVQSLGGIGAAAHRAVPMLTSLLSEQDEQLRQISLRSLADIGLTPDDAVPTLTAIKQGTNEWAARLAALALWNRDRENSELRAEVVAALQKLPGRMLLDLQRLGTNATPFVPEIKEILEHHPDDRMRRQAKRALRQLQASPPQPFHRTPQRPDR